MNFFAGFKQKLPHPTSVLLAFFSAVLLVLAFPDFDFWFLAWIALTPLLWAIDREKNSKLGAALTGWLFGTAFFAGSCWWLTHAPITYAGFPPVLAYFLLLCAAAIVGLFPALFSLLFSLLLKRFGVFGILSVPFLWTAIEFLRFWTTGNNWNAIGYSQAFNKNVLQYAGIGGVFLVGFIVLSANAFIAVLLLLIKECSKLKNSRRQSVKYIFSVVTNMFSLPFVPSGVDSQKTAKFARRYKPSDKIRMTYVGFIFSVLIVFVGTSLFLGYFGSYKYFSNKAFEPAIGETFVVAIQPNVPMSGLDQNIWARLRARHVELTEKALSEVSFEKPAAERAEKLAEIRDYEESREMYLQQAERNFKQAPKVVIFPESPMNFMYERDQEFQAFVRGFAKKNDVSVLFNAAEPDPENDRYFNSAVMADSEGKIAQYDKIYLVPFGESVPAPLQNIVPALVGSFSVGKEYDLLPFGDAKAGVMICFESHFPNLSREYVLRGADALVEMTNDGYLGNTPVLRQHLANAVFRAVETSRPVLRVTNVGITAYINENGEISDEADVYTEATRVWTVSRSDGKHTFYVRFGDWFAWFCALASLMFLTLVFLRRK